MVLFSDSVLTFLVSITFHIISLMAVLCGVLTLQAVSEVRLLPTVTVVVER